MDRSFTLVSALAVAIAALLASQATAQNPTQASSSSNRPEFPPFSEVSKGFEKVVSPDGKPTLYTIYKRDKDGQMLAELPRSFANQKHFIAMTIASGDTLAGLQQGDMYVYWKRYDKRLALIEPNVRVRSTGDQESKDSVERLFTDRVLLDVPILTMGPSGAPVIDLDALLVNQAANFFGPSVRVANPRLIAIKTAKAFPENIEVGFEVPVGGSSFSILGRSSGGSGRLQTLHYSISLIKSTPGYKPREADERVGYFVTGYDDYGQFKRDEARVRYINRWHLKKRDPSLSLSPPERPIVFYIEHTTPVRYRRWVQRGVEYWNKAFEKVGLLNAIEVRIQDKKLPTESNHMEKDPEDVRYNFIRWLSNDIPAAIGPSRVHPETGEILDADVVLNDGWIRYYLREYKETLPNIAMEGYGPQTLAWLDRHPRWDPRIRLAPPSQRDHLVAQRLRRGPLPYGGHPLASADPTLMGDDEFDGLVGRTSQVNGMCLAASNKAVALAQLRMMLAMQQQDDEDKGQDEEEKDGKDEEKKKEEEKDGKDEEKNKEEEKDKEKDDEDAEKKDDEKKEEKKKEDLLDGIPESFIGPLIADLVAHEVGHTLGLRHNFKASSAYPLSKINSEEFKGKKPLAGSVMDYLPVNVNVEEAATQGDWAMIDIGPYDQWAIEYGYTQKESDLKKVLERVAEPELQYATDEDTYGPDPLARRYDFAADPLSYANNQMKLAKHHRERLLEKFVKDGESWSKARRGYEMTLYFQLNSISMMGNWIGGSYVHRDKKGDKNARPPSVVVPAEKQRAALDFVIKNTFEDEVYGLTPELLKHLTVDKWLDGDSLTRALTDDPTWPVHDRIMSIQASVLTMLMNPTTLERVYDNEFRLPADTDALTLPELLDTLTAAIWSELEQEPDGQFTARKPMISSLRRNLQREHMERLMDLTKPDPFGNAALKPIANLATMHLRRLSAKIATILSGGGEARVDPYSLAHLSEAKLRIDKALDAQFIYNTDDIGGGGFGGIFLFETPQNGVPQELQPQE